MSDKSEHEIPDWPPHLSAVDLPDGEFRHGSTGQLFEVKNGQWIRASGGRPVPHHGSGPDGFKEVERLLTKIIDLAHDEHVGEPLDDAIGYANKALFALIAARQAAAPQGREAMA